MGVLNNLLGYLLYLLVTFLGVEPKLAISLLYPIAAATAYFGHLKYAFTYKAGYARPFPRYVISHLIGYGTNFLMLYICVDRLGFAHPLVQAAATFVVAGVLFLLFRYFVFPGRQGVTQGWRSDPL